MQAIQKLDMNEVNKDLRLKDFPSSIINQISYNLYYFKNIKFTII